ncbi:acyltransferase family protein, partial [Enterobacter roggenkampii]
GSDHRFVFLFGVFSAVLHCRHNIKVSNAMGDSIILLIISILFIISPGVIENVFRFQPIDLMNKYVFLGILFTILIFILCNTSGYSAVFFSNKAFRFIGKYSFSIYLYHWLFLTNNQNIYGGQVETIFANTIMSIALGVLMFYLCETPMNYIRKSIENFAFKRKEISPET